MSGIDPSARKSLSLITAGVALLLIAVLGAVGIVTIRGRGDSQQIFYDTYHQGVIITQIKESLLRDRAISCEAALDPGDLERLDFAAQESYRLHAEFGGLLDEYEKTIVNPEAKRVFDELKKLYYTEYMPHMEHLPSALQRGDGGECARLLSESGEAFDKICSSADFLQEMNAAAVADFSDYMIHSGHTSTILFVSVLAASVVILLVLFVALIVI